MDTSPSHIRTLTRPVVEALSPVDAVTSIVCFGSYALGTADAYSDVDLMIICEPVVIPAVTRQTIFGRLSEIQGFQCQASTAGWTSPWAPESDIMTMASITIDMTYNTREWIVDVVEQVLQEGALSVPAMPFRPYTLLGLLETSVVLYDPDGIVEGLRQRLQPYSAALQANIFRAYEPIMIESLAELRDYVHRDIGPGAFLFHVGWVCDALSSILYALNERYDPAPKRGEAMLRQLSVMPDDGVNRLIAIQEGPFDAHGRECVVEELSSFVAEVQRLMRGVHA